MIAIFAMTFNMRISAQIYKLSLQRKLDINENRLIHTIFIIIPYILNRESILNFFNKKFYEKFTSSIIY